MPRLMTHLVGNYPNPTDFQQALQAMFEFNGCGVDYLEIQLPFKNPLADGDLIYKANLEAQSYKISCQDLIKSIQKPRNCTTKLILMSYITPLAVIGFGKVCEMLNQNKFYGFIVPDLIFGSPEQKSLTALCYEFDLVLIPVVSPMTDDIRLRIIATELKSQQVIYAMARSGKTGQKTQLSDNQDYFDRLKTTLPDFEIAVGFGIRDQNQVKYLNSQNLTAVIGSQIVKQINIAATDNTSIKTSITQYLQTLN